MNDPFLLTAHELSAAYRSGTLTPVDAVDAFLSRIKTTDPHHHAFIDVYADDARRAAESATHAIRAKQALGPFHGVPIALKDLIDIEGHITTAGSAAFKDRRATASATLVHKALAAGLVILGKVHTVELAFGGWGTNPFMGAPLNPWRMDTHYTPGGSSSGSGVAVAARLAPWAVGTDTGGSVRIPSSFCGLTGLKVTRGRISNHGIAPLSITLDSPGPMARSVEDVAALFGILQGEDSNDPLSKGIAPIDPFFQMRSGIRGMQLGRLSAKVCKDMDSGTLACYESTLDGLARAGAEIVEVTLPHHLPDYAGLMGVLAGEGYAVYAELADDPSSAIDPVIRQRLLTGKIAAKDYLRLLWRRGEMANAFVAAMDGVDALLTPTTPAPAQPIEGIDENTTPAMLTRFANLLGLCALAVPSGLSPDGLPYSLQIIARGFDETTALRIGWAWQQITDWHSRTPPGIG